ncbi:MAG: tetratricopeptide repeat protein, partial [Myxococcota bacterium]
LGASPSAHTPTPKNNLPAEVDAFIGREAALRTLSESLNESRLVSILGTAGMGKTRLALQFGQRHLLEYPGGVFFCDLSEVKTLEGILFAVSKAMDVPLGKGDPLKQLGHAIAGHRQCLFIFDNFEQLTEFASQTIKQWLERSAQARFVVTSRVLLGLSGEFPLRLVPLDEDEGVTLFVERAVRKKRGFTLTAQNRGAVHQLVRLLDGLPLAIELATCRIKVMRPQQILKRMNQRFKLLSAGNRNTARRQATLRAAIDWSWELLEDWEQAAFAQCAVFEDGFTLEAAEAVIDLDAFDGASPLDAPERPAPWPMDAVQSLVDKSLLRPLGENRRGEMRFGMLMSIHDYAKEKLGRMNDAAVASIRRRHASFFARFGAEGTPDALMRFDGVSRWWALRLEMDNLIAAHRFALDTGDVDDAISLALALSVIAQNQHPSVAISALNETLNLGGIQAASRRATVHRKLGWLLRIRGHTKQALVQYAQALSIHREVGNRDGESRVMDNLGTLYMEQGQMKQALVHYTQALSIHREIGNRFDEGNILNNMGILYKRLGQVEQAMKHYIQALSIHREVGNRRSEGMLLGNLGALYGSQGQLAEAKAYYTQALSIHREVGNRHSEGNILGNLGILYKNHGQLERALAHYTQALSIHREVGNRRSEGAELTRLGTLRMVLGQTAQAQAAYTQALEIVRDAGDRFGEGHLLCNLGTLQMQKGQLSEAQAYHTQALSIHREVGDRRNEGVVLGELGMLEVLEGKTRAGLRRLEQGEALLREANALLLLGILLCYRAHAEHLANHPDAAATALREAKQIADDLNVGSDSELGKKIPKTQAILDKPVPSTSI